MQTASHRYFADWLVPRLRKELPSYALRHFDGALAGDEDAAGSLIVAAPNGYRDAIPLLMYLRGMGGPAYGAALSRAWYPDNDAVLDTVRHRGRLKAMFRRGAFILPELPDVVRLWRGTTGLNVRTAERGVSWTLDRNIACFFASRFGMKLPGAPLVIAADVPREMLVFHTDERSEAQVVCFDVKGAWDDGDATWVEDGNTKETLAAP